MIEDRKQKIEEIEKQIMKIKTNKDTGLYNREDFRRLNQLINQYEEVTDMMDPRE